jgi:DNA-binding NtrC family response regulator
MSEPSVDKKPVTWRGSAARGRLLLVDDNIQDLRDYCTSLQQQGYDASCSASFPEGANSISEEAFDLVVVSQGSPAFEGRAVLERAIEKDRSTRVLVITHAADMGSYLEAMQLGAADYVEKPTIPSDIIGLVRIHLRPASRAARFSGSP